MFLRRACTFIEIATKMTEMILSPIGSEDEINDLQIVFKNLALLDSSREKVLRNFIGVTIAPYPGWLRGVV